MFKQPVNDVILVYEVKFHIIIVRSFDPLANKVPSVLRVFKARALSVWPDKVPNTLCVLTFNTLMTPS